MNILVNGTILLAPLTGIGQYVRHLFTAMQSLPAANIRMFYGTHCEQGMKMPGRGATQTAQRAYGFMRQYMPRPRAMKKLAERVMFRYHSRSVPDRTVYHEPNYELLPYKGPVVLTICDLSCFDHPESHPAERVRIMQRGLPAALQRADHIVVISEATGTALQQWFGVDPARITTTYLAADARFQPRTPEMLQPALAGMGLAAGGYVLSVGTLEPRKNLDSLFSAYAGLPSALRKRFPLVVAGMNGWHTQGLMKSAEELIRRGELRLLGYVPDAMIAPLYAGAAAFCYPSRYEGFGLPALEAMASGVPVVTGNLTSLPEVVGDAGLMASPDDVDGMREHLRLLLEDRKFAADLGRQGWIRAKSFSWEKCARETFSVYEKVLQQRGVTQ